MRIQNRAQAYAAPRLKVCDTTADITLTTNNAMNLGTFTS